MSSFTGKTAIVTGATSGIGSALGEELAKRGAIVFATGRDEARGRALVERIERAGGRASATSFDVTDAAAMQALVDEVVRRHERIDYLFNNAGMGIMGATHELTLEDWRRVIDVNVHGVVHGIHACYPLMMRQRSGHIVNTSSLGGLVPMPFAASYVASKFAVVGLSQSLRAEAALYGVKVSVVCPASVDTPIWENNEFKGTTPDKFRGAVPDRPMSAEACVRVILRGVERNRAIIAPGAAGLLYGVHRHFPAFTRKMAEMFGKRLSAS